MSIFTDLLKEVPVSAVLRERLTEAEAKMAALEKEIARLEAEGHAIKADNQNLHVELQKAREEIERLRQQPRLDAAWGSQPRVPGRMS